MIAKPPLFSPERKEFEIWRIRKVTKASNFNNIRAPYQIRGVRRSGENRPRENDFEGCGSIRSPEVVLKTPPLLGNFAASQKRRDVRFPKALRRERNWVPTFSGNVTTGAKGDCRAIVFECLRPGPALWPLKQAASASGGAICRDQSGFQCGPSQANPNAAVMRPPSTRLNRSRTTKSIGSSVISCR